MGNLSQISVCIIAKNAQKTLKECLEVLKEFDEVILLDNESTDDTIKIAKDFSNVKIFSSPFIGFGPLKNLAISKAKNNWILSLDSDEVLEDEAKQIIATLKLEKHHIYGIKRKNYYDGTWIKACGWYPDFVWRLFNKTHTIFQDQSVHESLKISQNTQKIKLNIHLKHYTFFNVSQMLQKLDSYTTLATQKNIYKKSSISKAFLRFLWVFFKDYFLRSGWRYGYKGFVIAWMQANGSFFKYIKIYEKQQQEKKHKINPHP
ncbi:glycosyltransferase family 2 protein [Helicobacter sp. faydin-H20]|nr:glycosyltransferase family 2 protein [Helicobacter anatolicus]